MKNEIEENERRFTWYPNCIRQYRLSRKVVKKMLALKELLAPSEFHRGASPLPDVKFYPDVNKTLQISEIMEALEDGAVSLIAVWGMAGVGKSTLVGAVKNRATNKKLFDRVIMASLSSPSDLKEIQDKFADSLHFKINTETRRAEKLWLRLKNERRILLILEDVWDGVNLKDIGIPYGEDHKGCKILLTTRCEQVCIDMRIQKVIRLDILSDDEACDLLKKNTGYQSDADSPYITTAASEIAKECLGLPIAMVQLGESLRGCDLNQWEITSQSLRSLRFQDDECFKALRATYQCLQLSYDHLRKQTTKSYFLLCSLFPKDYAIDVEDLTRYAWGLGFYNSIDLIDKVRCEVWAAIQNLISSCLLLDNGERSVKMHNLVRHCALWRASQENFPFMKEWQEIEYLSERFVDEDQLAILSLNGSGGRTSSSTRMQGMKSLKVFTHRLRDGHLSDCPLEKLINLRTLHLVCCQLYDISSLGRLEKLEILSFRGSEISELPDELGGLNYLRLLDLFDCQNLQKVPLNLIRKLSRLEELYFSCHSFEEWWFEETSTEGSQARPSKIISSCSLAPSLQAYEIAIEENGSSNDHNNPTSRILRVRVSLDTVECLHFNRVFEKTTRRWTKCKGVQI